MNPMCCICGSTNTRHRYDSRDHVTGETFGLWQCNECEFGFTWPRPPSLDHYYAEFYRRYDKSSAGILQRLQQRRARRWVRTLGPTGRFLDIGCGDGWILAEIQRYGWRVVGLERTAESARFAHHVQRVPVIVGSLEALRDGAGFDLIVLHQALEHLPDPMTTLRHCYRLLKPGGRLVVAVPNLASWQARWARGDWLHLDVPRHVGHFTPLSLRHALERAGMCWESIRYVSWEYDPIGWVEGVLNKLGFPMNTLLRIIQHDPRIRPISPTGLAALGLAAPLIVPATLLALLSWLFRSGAIMEVQAIRPPGATT